MIEFTAWPKTPRLFRDIIVTEKIDGTNAGIHIVPVDVAETERVRADDEPFIHYVHRDDGTAVQIVAQSRNRLLAPGKLTDNFGFASWVHEHAAALVVNLGPGLHFGEWWGNGIQRGYGLAEGDKRFSLFNVHRYSKLLPLHEDDDRERVPGLGVVPVLDTFTFDTQRVKNALYYLEENGSQAAPGFMRPEGIVVFHSASRSVFKALIENDEIPKGEAQ